jgi:hypothetical protein
MRARRAAERGAVQGGLGQRACLEECRAAGPGYGLACAAWRRLRTRDLAHCGVAAAAGLGAAPFQPQIRTLPIRSGHLVAGRRAGSPTHLGHQRGAAMLQTSGRAASP